MSRFFLDVVNGHGVAIDDEGIEVATPSVLAAIAYDNIRSMVAEDARQGMIDLQGKIVVRDETGAEQASFAFAQAFQLLISPADLP